MYAESWQIHVDLKTNNEKQFLASSTHMSSGTAAVSAYEFTAHPKIQIFFSKFYFYYK
jgi:hypothetical protein